MCGKLDCYLKSFADLRTDTNKNRWPNDTCHRDPRKPLLLLSIFDHIARQKITRNFIEPSPELERRFQQYWSLIMPAGTSASMSYPFYHLGSADFWNLVPQPGQIHQQGLTVSTVQRLKELYLGARLSEDLYPLLVMETHREKIRSVLIQTYFTQPTQNILIDQGETGQSTTE